MGIRLRGPEWEAYLFVVALEVDGSVVLKVLLFQHFLIRFFVNMTLIQKLILIEIMQNRTCNNLKLP